MTMNSYLNKLRTAFLLSVGVISLLALAVGATPVPLQQLSEIRWDSDAATSSRRVDADRDRPAATEFIDLSGWQLTAAAKRVGTSRTPNNPSSSGIGATPAAIDSRPATTKKTDPLPAIPAAAIVAMSLGASPNAFHVSPIVLGSSAIPADAGAFREPLPFGAIAPNASASSKSTKLVVVLGPATPKRVSVIRR